MEVSRSTIHGSELVDSATVHVEFNKASNAIPDGTIVR
jgi:hypothetical protein